MKIGFIGYCNTPFDKKKAQKIIEEIFTDIQRYVNLKDTFEYIIPPEIQDDEECLKIYNETIARGKWAYDTISNKLKNKYILNGMSMIKAEKKAI